MSDLIRFINFGIDAQAPQKPDHGRRLYLLANGDFATIDSVGVVTSLATRWEAITGKPSVFPPEAHTHLTSEITDFATAVEGIADDADNLTTGTLPDARLSSTVTTSLGKADTALQAPSLMPYRTSAEQDNLSIALSIAL